jgi:hypothetical protein
MSDNHMTDDHPATIPEPTKKSNDATSAEPQVGCCAASELTTCCEPGDKAGCCGAPVVDEPPSHCGCR